MLDPKEILCYRIIMVEKDLDHSSQTEQNVASPATPTSELQTADTNGELSVLEETYPSISPKQSGRLKAFEHMLQVANKQEGLINEGQLHEYGVVEDGKMKSKYFDLDSRFVYGLNQIAWNMYEDELTQSPETKQAADEILKKQKTADETIMTPDQLYDLFQRE